jgi:hypothetical protein
MGASAFTQRAFAVEPASKLEEVWAEIQAGKFDLAAQRLQLHATEWPLDREVRANLAIMQFAAEMFDKAEENFRWVVKLQRARTPVATQPFNIDYLEAWYHLAQLRAGHAPDAPTPASAHSLLLVLRREEEVQSFAAKATDAYFAYLDRVQEAIGETTAVGEGVTATLRMNVERPDREAVEQSCLCTAHFALGERALGLGDRAAGQSSLAAAIASKAEGAVEHHIAKAELARLGTSAP